MAKKRANINPGDTYGRLEIVQEVDSRKKYRHFLCRCSCGKEIELPMSNLRSGHSRSCGCYNREIARLRKTHGETNTRLYQIWIGMKKRCNNPNNRAYKWYGAEGIKLCSEWESYESFRDWAMENGYMDNLTIERKRHNGNYEPDNCTWILLSKQMSNTRDCKPVTIKGLSFPTIVSAARYFRVPPPTAYNRIRRGLSIEEVFGVAE